MKCLLLIRWQMRWKPRACLKMHLAVCLNILPAASTYEFLRQCLCMQNQGPSHHQDAEGTHGLIPLLSSIWRMVARLRAISSTSHAWMPTAICQAPGNGSKAQCLEADHDLLAASMYWYFYVHSFHVMQHGM